VQWDLHQLLDLLFTAAAAAAGRRRLLSANSANTIPHIAHSIAKSVIVGGNGTDGSSGSGDMGSGNRTAGGASSGSAEICKEICKPSVTPVTKMVGQMPGWGLGGQRVDSEVQSFKLFRAVCCLEQYVVSNCSCALSSYVE
jgi:hypothetical protein